jgi:outer membrane immunogenic protein
MMQIKTLALIGIAMIALPQPAAADGAFGGFYGGAALGYGFNGTSTIPDGGSVYDFDIKGNQISLIGGYNVQAGSFVFGVEGDANFGKIKDRQTVTIGPFRYDGTAASETFYSVRARIGFTPIEDLLLFATAGPAWGSLATSTILTAPTVLGPLSPFDAVNAKKDVTGVVLGVGCDYKFGETARFRLDYTELTFNDVRFVQRNPGGPSSTFSTDNSASFVRSGLTFSF